MSAMVYESVYSKEVTNKCYQVEEKFIIAVQVSTIYLFYASFHYVIHNNVQAILLFLPIWDAHKDLDGSGCAPSFEAQTHQELTVSHN